MVVKSLHSYKCPLRLCINLAVKVANQCDPSESCLPMINVRFFTQILNVKLYNCGFRLKVCQECLCPRVA